MSVRYRTIVADPPWSFDGHPLWSFRKEGMRPQALPYADMALDAIKALPVADLAADDCHLYLWTTQRHLPLSFDVVTAWGFHYSTPLVWCKTPRKFFGTPTFSPRCEFVLFCHKGKVGSLTRIDRNWFEWGTGGAHSQKPEAFLDLVESISPGPYLEMFSRRARLGWDTWGDEALHGTGAIA